MRSYGDTLSDKAIQSTLKSAAESGKARKIAACSAKPSRAIVRAGGR